MSDTPQENPTALCQSCGLQPAAVEFVHVSGNERREVALCRECAATHGVGMQLDAFQRLAQLLMHQMRPIGQVAEEWQQAMAATCSRCGLVFEQFVQTGLLGCPQCYTDFHDYLTPVLRRLHGVTKLAAEDAAETKANGAVHADVRSPNREELEAALQLALAEENFERAATIRDELKRL